MRVIRSVQEMQAWSTQRRAGGEHIGLVPTQGCLHDGHASLLYNAREQCDRVVLSVFVNPLQFRKDGYKAYPRRLEADLKIARDCGVDVVFCPDAEAMYPVSIVLDDLFDLQSGLSGDRDPKVFTIDRIPQLKNMPYLRVPDRLVMRMDGAGYPWHFDGVATVVSRLFEAVGPTHAYFGQKDIQQYAILDALTAWLDLGIEIIPVPVMRESDGVSSSSRLVLLNGEQRMIASQVAGLLFEVVRTRIGEPVEQVVDWFMSQARSIETGGNVLEIDRIECVHPETLETHDRFQESSAIYVAYLINGIRLAETRRCDE